MFDPDGKAVKKLVSLLDHKALRRNKVFNSSLTLRIV
jgi:hypothetical protein